MLAYLEIAERARAALEQVGSGSWPSIDTAAEGRAIDENPVDLNWPRAELIELLAHLRHHRFPSPLLDWTLCPHVAAFFAYQDPGDPAIYVLREYTGRTKWGQGDVPLIRRLGWTLETPDRHRRQKSDYTICTRYECGSAYFVSHEGAYNREEHPNQDLILKLILPAADREKALRRLDGMGIHSAALFGNAGAQNRDDEILKAIAQSEFGVTVAR